MSVRVQSHHFRNKILEVKPTNPIKKYQPHVVWYMHFLTLYTHTVLKEKLFFSPIREYVEYSIIKIPIHYDYCSVSFDSFKNYNNPLKWLNLRKKKDRRNSYIIFLFWCLFFQYGSQKTSLSQSFRLCICAKIHFMKKFPFYIISQINNNVQGWISLLILREKGTQNNYCTIKIIGKKIQ